MRPIKRIQRNARPSDAYNDDYAVIATGSERSDLLYDAVRSSDTRVHVSTVTPNEPERSSFVTNAWVERCGSKTDAAHGRMRMAREELNPENVHKADTVSLLRARARTLRAKYERMRSCHENYAMHSFNFASPEETSTDAVRIEALRRTSLAQERWLDTTYAMKEGDPEAMQC